MPCRCERFNVFLYFAFHKAFPCRLKGSHGLEASVRNQTLLFKGPIATCIAPFPPQSNPGMFALPPPFTLPFSPTALFPLPFPPYLPWGICCLTPRGPRPPTPRGPRLPLRVLGKTPPRPLPPSEVAPLEGPSRPCASGAWGENPPIRPSNPPGPPLPLNLGKTFRPGVPRSASPFQAFRLPSHLFRLGVPPFRLAFRLSFQRSARVPPGRSAVPLWRSTCSAPRSAPCSSVPANVPPSATGVPRLFRPSVPLFRFLFRPLFRGVPPVPLGRSAFRSTCSASRSGCSAPVPAGVPPPFRLAFQAFHRSASRSTPVPPSVPAVPLPVPGVPPVPLWCSASRSAPVPGVPPPVPPVPLGRSASPSAVPAAVPPLFRRSTSCSA